MSTKLKTIILLLLFLQVGKHADSQTLELNSRALPSTGSGPAITPLAPIFVDRDELNNNLFAEIPLPSNQLSVSVSFDNQKFRTVDGTMLSYSNISTGLVFGAEPTTAIALPGETDPTIQKVYPGPRYHFLGYYSSTTTAVGAPTDVMFTSNPLATPTEMSGTGVIPSTTYYNPTAQNGINTAFQIFTAAQVLFDRPGGNPPLAHNSTDRHHIGDVVITFNRIVNRPVIHIAGLGGAYRYRSIATGNPWVETFFSTELDVVSPFSITRMSGNPYFTVSGNQVKNSAPEPSGASVDAPFSLNGQNFNDYGASTGSFRINGPGKSIRLKVFMRGCSTSDFPWSAIMSSMSGSPDRNPFTGDFWWLSVTSAPTQLIPLPATGIKLNALLNGKDVQLNWRTLSELDTREFDIERSTDGINFTKIGSKDAAGSSAVETNYDYVDPNMQAPVYYYRLKLWDNDNKFTYSNVEPVRLLSGNIRDVKVFPNPVVGQEQLKLEFANAKGDYLIKLFNNNGQEVYHQKAMVNFAYQTVLVNKGKLTPGTYIMKTTNIENGDSFSNKLIVQ